MPGTIWVGPSTESVKALQNFSPSKGVEYVFEPASSTFVVGNGTMKHTPLAASIDADTSQVVGGIFTRGSNGSILTPEQAGQVLGLPAAQAANILKNDMDFYAITPKVGVMPNVFVSNVASTAQGAATMPGGAQQVIVPNRSLWTAPTPVNPFTLRSTGVR